MLKIFQSVLTKDFSIPLELKPLMLSVPILPLSYLCFGLMWVISCFTKVPLTAHYSANDYNGEKAFNNPLFMKTNQILTIMWGILYVFTSVMTYFIMKTEFSSYLGIINNILPILMGIFTAWFQKWYPAKIARLLYRG